MTRRQFETLVDSALRKLRRAFRDKLANIAVVVEDWADDQTLAEMGPAVRSSSGFLKL